MECDSDWRSASMVRVFCYSAGLFLPCCTIWTESCTFSTGSDLCSYLVCSCCCWQSV